MMSATSQPSTIVSAGLEDAGRPALMLVVEDDAALLTLIEKRLAGQRPPHGRRGGWAFRLGLAETTYSQSHAAGLQPARHARRATAAADRRRRGPRALRRGHRTWQRKRGRRNDETRRLRLPRQGAGVHETAAGGGRAIGGAGDRPSDWRGRRAIAASPRRTGAARPATHWGTGRGQPAAALEMDDAAAPRSKSTGIRPSWPT